MVRLLPHRDNNALIKCEIFDYVLLEKGGTKHLYEALSYVWDNYEEGNAVKSQPIELNSHTFYITPNLHAALVNIRNHHFDRILWVDAICINQDNEAEKSMYIPLMRTIYAQANCIMIWLAEAFEEGDTALENIRFLAEYKMRNMKPLGAQSFGEREKRLNDMAGSVNNIAMEVMKGRDPKKAIEICFTYAGQLFQSQKKQSWVEYLRCSFLILRPKAF